jgi:hypothetical protein
MKIANRVNENTKSRMCECRPQTPFTLIPSDALQPTAVRPGKRNHHV